MYSVVVGDKVHDIKYKKYGDQGFRVYLGEKELGIIFKPVRYRKGWEVVVYHSHKARNVKGFISRVSAMEFMLQDLGYHWDDTYDITDYLIFQSNMRIDR